MTAVVLDGVTVGYDDVEVVRDLHLAVAPGEWLCLIGPNGAGKSTVLRAVAGLVRHKGTIRIGGARVAGMDPRRLARRVAFVPQQPVVPPGVAVGDYVLLGRTPHLGYLGRERRRDLEVVAEVLDRLDLLGFVRRNVGSLSGGERQRVVVARALAQEAPVLLLDEPTSALDVGHQQHVLELVERLRREDGLTVVSAMHDLTLAGQFADRLLLLAGGRLAACGDAAAVLTEGTIGEHYGAAVRVLHDDDGGVIVIPTRRPRPAPPGYAPPAEPGAPLATCAPAPLDH